jgi:hypothetical protein
MKLGQVVAMMNNVFSKRYGRENVIALWSEEQLSTFALTELTTLKSLAESERLNDPAAHDLCSRLIQRIERVQREYISS